MLEFNDHVVIHPARGAQPRDWHPMFVKPPNRSADKVLHKFGKCWFFLGGISSSGFVNHETAVVVPVEAVSEIFRFDKIFIFSGNFEKRTYTPNPFDSSPAYLYKRIRDARKDPLRPGRFWRILSDAS